MRIRKNAGSSQGRSGTRKVDLESELVEGELIASVNSFFNSFLSALFCDSLLNTGARHFSVFGRVSRSVGVSGYIWVFCELGIKSGRSRWDQTAN